MVAKEEVSPIDAHGRFLMANLWIRERSRMFAVRPVPNFRTSGTEFPRDRAVFRTFARIFRTFARIFRTFAQFFRTLAQIYKSTGA